MPNATWATAVLLVAIGCSNNPEPDGAPETTRNTEVGSTANRNSNVITEAELADPILSGDALQAVQHLRPRFLVMQGVSSLNDQSAGSIHIQIDGGPLMTVSNLNLLRPDELSEIRYLTPSEATQLFGSRSNRGAVLLVHRKR